MTPKLLLALALVGAACAQPTPPMPVSTFDAGLRAADRATLDHYSFKDSTGAPWLQVNFDPASKWFPPDKVKLIVTREPTVTKKPDGAWEITFAEKAPAVLWPNDKIDTDRAAWIAAESTKSENKSSLVIHGYYSGESPLVYRTNNKSYEFGLRSDGVVVWRERK